jgi:hypothetical protein
MGDMPVVKLGSLFWEGVVRRVTWRCRGEQLLHTQVTLSGEAGETGHAGPFISTVRVLPE